MLCITQSCHVTSFWAVIQISVSSRLIKYVFTRAKTALVAPHPPLSLACCFDIWAVFLDLALHALPLKRDEMAFCLLSFTSCLILKDTLTRCLVYGLRDFVLLSGSVPRKYLPPQLIRFLLDLWLFVAFWWFQLHVGETTSQSAHCCGSLSSKCLICIQVIVVFHTAVNLIILNEALYLNDYF